MAKGRRLISCAHGGRISALCCSDGSELTGTAMQKCHGVCTDKSQRPTACNSPCSRGEFALIINKLNYMLVANELKEKRFD
jgi:hypothetical protein